MVKLGRPEKEWSLTDAKRLVRARNRGESYKKIGAEMKLSYSQLIGLSKWVIKNAEIVHRSMGTYGDILPKARKRLFYERETREEIFKLKIGGASYNEISAAIGLPRKAVVKIYHNYKIYKTLTEDKPRKERAPESLLKTRISTNELPSGWANLIP
ncbi:hypothetical protein [Nitrospira sp. BLG_2]|uniref:hypothetical protein n=1 Tax=Nitrospira sp. BLG_2 TaxID=3397507 RepID=UPI003B9CA09F